MRIQILLPAALLLLPGFLPAQDVLTLIDGKVLTVKMASMNAAEVHYKMPGSSGEKILSRERVARLEVHQRSVFRIREVDKAIKAENEEAWGEALDYYLKGAKKAERSKSIAGFAPQYLLWRAYGIARAQNAVDDMKDILAALKKNKANFFYLPNYLEQSVLEAFKSGTDRKALEAAKAAALAYKDQVAKAGLGDRYGYLATLYVDLSKLRLKEITPAQARAEFEKMLVKVKGSYPDLTNRLNLEVAYSSLLGGKIEEARQLFDAIIKSKSADDGTLARAYLGRGHTWFRQGTCTAAEAKKGLADFMRVPILFPDSEPAVQIEALEAADKAYFKWNGDNAKVNRARIRGRLRRLKG